MHCRAGHRENGMPLGQQPAHHLALEWGEEGRGRGGGGEESGNRREKPTDNNIEICIKLTLGSSQTVYL